MGVPLEQVLGRLGLSYSAPDGASNEEDTLQHQDQLWDMLIQMGERLLASQAVRVSATAVCFITLKTYYSHSHGLNCNISILLKILWVSWRMHRRSLF